MSFNGRKKILITGAAGFVASYLIEEIQRSWPAWIIHGTIRPKETLENIKQLTTPIALHDLDITDSLSVHTLLNLIHPDIIFHLAAQSYVRDSWESPQATLTTNILGEVNLLEAVRQLKTNKYNPIFVIAGSSEEYGLVSKKELPVTESAPLRPLSPYAVSKIGQDFLGYQYYKTYNLQTIRLRVFNHTGPRRPIAFGDSFIAHSIAMIEAGQKEAVITYRDLTAVRDYSDVRDVVQAYILAAEKCTPGEVYNVCSGTGTSIKEIYNTFLALAKVKKIKLMPDPIGPRPTDGGKIIGSNRKFCMATGYKPQIDFKKETLRDILEFWREQISV